MFVINNKKYILKKIYDEVIEDIFVMSYNMIIFKEIEKKNMGASFILCYVFGQLSSIKRLV